MLSSYDIQLLLTESPTCKYMVECFIFFWLSEGSMTKECISPTIGLREGIHLKYLTTAWLKEMDKTAM